MGDTEEGGGGGGGGGEHTEPARVVLALSHHGSAALALGSHLRVADHRRALARTPSIATDRLRGQRGARAPPGALQQTTAAACA